MFKKTRTFNHSIQMWAKLFNDAPNIYFPGKCVVALATDKNAIHRSGEIVTECELAKRYGLRDDNGG